MSGICGILALRGQRPDDHVLARMVETLHHRGPDDAQTHISGPCGLGAALLAVTQADRAASQPMHVIHVPRGRPDLPPAEVWGVHSGRVYNFAEVQKALQATGHRFSSNTDTETLLRSYIQFGPANFIKAFRGMFALAIWDEPRQKLLLLRDRLGQQPLYYALTGDWLVFGSEIKALLACPAVPCRLNEEAIPHYLAYGYPPSPETLFEGIQALQPGHMLTVDLSGEKPAFCLDAYWYPPYPFSETDTRTEEDIAADLLAHLRWAVRLCLSDGVSAGAWLSGRLDSAALVALMAHESSRTIQTFSPVLPGNRTFEDSRYGRQISARFVTEHHEVAIDPDAVNLADELVWYFDQPFGNPAALPAYLLSRATREQVAVALTGDGGDELLAGYAYLHTAQLARDYDQLPDVVQRAIEGLLDRLPDTIVDTGFLKQASRAIHAANLPLAERYLSWVRFVPAEWLAALMGGQREQAVQEHYASLFTMPQRSEETDVVAQLLDVNLRTRLPCDLLTRLDRCSMAASLEVRTPFLDHQLVHFIATIPSRLKLRRSTPRYILKQALRGILPDAIIDHRPAAPDEMSVDTWFRGTLGEYARAILLDERTAGRGIFDIEAMRAMLDAHLNGDADLGHALWTLLTFELWARRYFD